MTPRAQAAEWEGQAPCQNPSRRQEVNCHVFRCLRSTRLGAGWRGCGIWRGARVFWRDLPLFEVVAGGSTITKLSDRNHCLGSATDRNCNTSRTFSFRFGVRLRHFASAQSNRNL